MTHIHTQLAASWILAFMGQNSSRWLSLSLGITYIHCSTCLSSCWFFYDIRQFAVDSFFHGLNVFKATRTFVLDDH